MQIRSRALYIMTALWVCASFTIESSQSQESQPVVIPSTSEAPTVNPPTPSITSSEIIATPTSTETSSVPPSTSPQLPEEPTHSEAASLPTSEPSPTTEVSATVTAIKEDQPQQQSSSAIVTETSSEAPSAVSPTPPPAPLVSLPDAASSDDSFSLEDEDKEEEVDERQASIDTINMDEPKGNWLYKRVWWERGEKTYGTVSQIMPQLERERILFYQQRAELDRSVFDQFYLQAGVGLGELQEIIATILQLAEQKREVQGSLDEQERTFLQTVQDKQALLKGLDQQIKAVIAIDEGLDEDMMVLNKQLDQAQGYERQSWQLFKDITRELNDKKARELYYRMRGLKKNIRSIGQYIQRTLKGHFAQLVNSAKTKIQEVQKIIEQLRSERIDLKEFAKRLTQTECQKPSTVPSEDDADAEEETPQEEAGWFWGILNNITQFFTDIYDYIISFVSSTPSQVESDEEVIESAEGAQENT
jgi:hypothetical protein